MAVAFVGIFLSVGFSHAQMTSTNFQIRWDSISAGGSDISSSASFGLRDTVDQSAGSRTSSASYRLDSGYRSGIFDEIITFDLFVQDATSQTAVTAFVPNVISSNTAGFSVNDYVVLVQDRGIGQVAGVGRITAIGVNSLTIDELVTAGVSPIVDGTNDYVYRMSGATSALGTLSATSVATSVISFQVTAENSAGYVIQVMQSGGLTDGVETIDGVTDGAVTAGSEEYGARSSDTTVATSTFDTQDTAITSAAQSIVTSSSASFNQRSFLTLKAAMSAGTPAGAYGQTLTFIASGNF